MPKKAVIQIVAAVVSPCILPLLLAIKNDAGPKKADADDDTLNDPGDLRLRILRDRQHRTSPIKAAYVTPPCEPCAASSCLDSVPSQRREADEVGGDGDRPYKRPAGAPQRSPCADKRGPRAGDEQMPKDSD